MESTLGDTTFTACALLYRVSMHNVSVAVSSLPGNRFAGARRSLVADIGNNRSVYLRHPRSLVLLTASLKEAAIQDIFVLCTDDELRW